MLLNISYQRWTFLNFRTNVLARWLPSHSNLIFWSPASAARSWTRIGFQLPTSMSGCHYSTWLPSWTNSNEAEEVQVKLRPTISRTVCLGVRHPSRTRDQFFFLLEIFFWQLRLCCFVAPSLTRERVCNLLYNCFWALPEQSLLGRSPAELTPIFYGLIWDSPNLEGQIDFFCSLGTDRIEKPLPKFRPLMHAYISQRWL
jgi:hypothetical protein